MPVTRCNLLGPVELMIDGLPAPPSLLWRKNLALLVYLARAGGRAVPRDHLMALLWGEKPESAARHSLNEAVFVLRRHLGAQSLTTESGTVRLEPGSIQLDTDLFADRLHRGDFLGAAELVRGEFMHGFSIADCWEFDEWLASERQLWRERCVDAMAEAAQMNIARGSTNAAAALAERASRLDDLSEPALRARMLARALEGDRAGALGAFDAWRERTAREYALQPSLETEGLAERIRRERVWHPTNDSTERVRPAQRWPLVGREAQLETLLRERRECVRTGQLRMVAICGASGMGRTRLCEEVVARARLDGAHVSVARAVPSDRETCTDPLELLPADRPPGPASLLFDDIQWLAPGAIREFHAIARKLKNEPVFLMLSALAPPSTRELDELWSRLNVDVPGTVIRLDPLNGQAVRRLAEVVLPSYSPEDLDRLTRRVQADCAGVPFLVTSLLSAVAAGLELDPLPSAWPAPSHTMDDTLPARLPETAVAAIRIGFWQLSEAARHVLTAMAVLPEPARGEGLLGATRLQPPEMEQALDELEWKRWLAADARGYAFQSRLVREVVHTQMTTPGQRRRLIEAASAAPPTS